MNNLFFVVTKSVEDCKKLANVWRGSSFASLKLIVKTKGDVNCAEKTGDTIDTQWQP